MKKYISVVFCFLFAIASLNTFAATNKMSNQAAERGQKTNNTVNLYFFWSKDCPHCVAAHPFLDKLKQEYPWLRIHSLEISGHPKNSQRYAQMARAHGKETNFVPAFFICDKMIVGYTSERTTGSEIKQAILNCHNKS